MVGPGARPSAPAERRTARSSSRTRSPARPRRTPDAARCSTAPCIERGALTLHALRLTVGDDAFVRILRTYLDRFGGKTASTADFVTVASEVAGHDLTAFFDTWLGPGPGPAAAARRRRRLDSAPDLIRPGASAGRTGALTPTVCRSARRRARSATRRGARRCRCGARASSRAGARAVTSPTSRPYQSRCWRRTKYQ